MVVKQNCIFGGIKTTEFEGRQYHKAQLFDLGETLSAKVDARLKNEISNLPLNSTVSCELHVYDYGNKIIAELISAVPAK